MKAIAAVCLGLGFVLAGPAMAQTAQPAVAIMPTPNAANLAKARQFITIMYHDDQKGDMEDWLSERLMDQYRRAFNLADSWDETQLHAAIMAELKSIPQRLHPIVERHTAAIRATGINDMANLNHDGTLDALLQVAQTSGGKAFFEWRMTALFNQRALAPLLSENGQLADEINAELAKNAGEALTRHPELAKAITTAGRTIH